MTTLTLLILAGAASRMAPSREAALVGLSKFVWLLPLSQGLAAVGPLTGDPIVELHESTPTSFRHTLALRALIVFLDALLCSILLFVGLQALGLWGGPGGFLGVLNTAGQGMFLIACAYAGNAIAPSPSSVSLLVISAWIFMLFGINAALGNVLINRTVLVVLACVAVAWGYRRLGDRSRLLPNEQRREKYNPLNRLVPKRRDSRQEAMIPAGVAIVRLEMRRVLRRRHLWMSLGPAYVVIVLLGAASSTLNSGRGTARVGDWGVFMNLLLGIVFSASFVGTLGIRGAGGLSQLQRSTPTPVWKQLSVRVLGALAVTMPALAVLLLVGVIVGFTEDSWEAVPAAVAVYTLVTLPATVFTLGVVAVAEKFLPTTFARIVAVVIWAWAALFDTSTIPAPSLGGTILSPTGLSASAAFFGADASPRAFTQEFALANIAVVLLIGIAAIMAAGIVDRR